MKILALVALLFQTASPCPDPEYRQFDFWIGKWRVERPDGKFAGTNEISRVLGGCVLHERWSGASGMKGESFNIWDKSRKLWHQTWVDTSGLLLEIEGKYADGRMVLSDKTNRITWSKLENGRVRQHWETSGDGGKTWQDAFVGIYVPVP